MPDNRLQIFDGPLDLLLDEVRSQNVDIEHIALAPVVARYLEYVRTASAQKVLLDIEWLHMAAILIHWKSLSLLPVSAEDHAAAETIRADVVQQLSLELARRKSAEETRFSRAEPVRAAIEGPTEPVFSSVWELLQQARDLGQWVRRHRENRSRWSPQLVVEPDESSLSEMIDYVRAQFADASAELDGRQLLYAEPVPSRRAGMFLAILELAHRNDIQVEQTEPFGPICVHLRSSAAIQNPPDICAQA